MEMITLKKSLYFEPSNSLKKRLEFLTEDKSDAERRGKAEHARKNANSYTGRISGGNLKELSVKFQKIVSITLLGSRDHSIFPSHTTRKMVICGDYCSYLLMVRLFLLTYIITNSLFIHLFPHLEILLILLICKKQGIK